MQNTQQVLVAVIFALVVVIGILVWDRQNRPPTFGEQVGQTIDHATQQLDKAIDDGAPHRRYNP
jgi:hypothetical protein